MSIKPPSMKSGSTIVRVLTSSVMVLIVVGLQLALPMISYRWAGDRSDDLGNEKDSTNGNRFWNQRLRFDGFLAPEDLRYEPAHFMSAAVHKRELIVLLKTDGADGPGALPNEVVRLNLQTGWATTSPAPKGVRHVLSDGKTLW